MIFCALQREILITDIRKVKLYGPENVYLSQQSAKFKFSQLPHPYEQKLKGCSEYINNIHIKSLLLSFKTMKCVFKYIYKYLDI